MMWLDRAYEERRPQILEVPIDPVFDVLQDDPRFAELVRRIGERR